MAASRCDGNDVEKAGRNIALSRGIEAPGNHGAVAAQSQAVVIARRNRYDI